MKAPEAGNTTETLKPVNVTSVSTDGLPSAADLDAVAEEQRIAAATSQTEESKEEEITAAAKQAIDADSDLKAQIEAEVGYFEDLAENVVEKIETVAKADFDALVARLEGLEERIRNFNSRSGHHI